MKGFFKVTTILLIVIFTLLGGAYAYFNHFVWGKFYDNEHAVLDKKQEELNRAIEEAKGYGAGRPFVFLAAGIDTNDVNSGRSDSLMVVFVDTKDKKINLLSLPRDLRVDIPGRGTDKINAAYAYGGISLAKETVSTYLDVPIDNYMVINFRGFKELIDTIGGLDIDVEKDMRFHDRISNQWVSFKKGPQTLNGAEALNYSRFRKDAEGDYGRMRRQQQVISEIISQTADFDNVMKTNEIIKVLGKNMKTDVKFNNATKLAVLFAGSTKANIKDIEIKSYPAMMGGVSYVVMDDNEVQNVKTRIERILKRENTVSE